MYNLEFKKHLILNYLNLYILKYQVCLAVQHLDVLTVQKEMKMFKNTLE